MSLLESLVLSNNDLTTLSTIDFNAMPSLRELDVSNNRLSALPAEIANLTGLITLDIDNNEIKELPPQLSVLPALTNLYVGTQNGNLR